MTAVENGDANRDAAMTQNSEGSFFGDDNSINLMILFHCSAGKDRTGIIGMLILLTLGVDEQEVVDSYGQSCSHFADKNPSSHLAASLRKLDEKTTRRILVNGSPPSVLRTTLRYMKEYYGTVFGYLDDIQFGIEWRERLRGKMLLGYG